MKKIKKGGFVALAKCLSTLDKKKKNNTFLAKLNPQTFHSVKIFGLWLFFSFFDIKRFFTSVLKGVHGTMFIIQCKFCCKQ